MKVVCTNFGEDLEYAIDNSDLTIGKSYEVISSSGIQIIDNIVRLYYIKNDVGFTKKYNSRLFCSIEDWREIQLKKINI